MSESKSRAAVRARAGAAAVAPTSMDAAAEGASQWGRYAMDDVTGDASVEEAAPWRSGIEHWRRREVE
jgi:hypothetical protein